MTTAFFKIPSLRAKRWGPWLFLSIGVLMATAGVIFLFLPEARVRDTDDDPGQAEERRQETAAPPSASSAVNDLSPAPQLNQTVLINGTPKQGHTYTLTAGGCPGSEMVAESQVIPSSATLRFQAALADDAAPESKVAMTISQEGERVFEDILAPFEPVTVNAELSRGVYTMTISSLNGAEDDCGNTKFTVLMQNFSLSDG